MELSLAFEAFMVFYLLEVLFLIVFAWHLRGEYKQAEQEAADQAQAAKGPSPSDLIKMRAIAREMQRQG